jgi:hypothetical protein
MPPGALLLVDPLVEAQDVRQVQGPVACGTASAGRAGRRVEAEHGTLGIARSVRAMLKSSLADVVGRSLPAAEQEPALGAGQRHLRGARLLGEEVVDRPADGTHEGRIARQANAPGGQGERVALELLQGVQVLWCDEPLVVEPAEVELTS